MASERPAKRVKLLASDNESSSAASSDSESDAGNINLIINKDFAARYEHNQARAERHRLEEKYGKAPGAAGADLDESDDDSEDDEEEDDNAVLASGVLDEQFEETLKALRRKDPRIYKQEERFFDEGEVEGVPVNSKEKEKPMYLTDYHKQNLFSGKGGVDEDASEEKPRTFAQEQEALRKDVIKSMHAGDDEDEESEDDNEDGGFLVKSRIEAPEPATKDKNTSKISARDDPDAFLDDFLSRRAWVPTDKSQMQAFESDDEDYDEKAEEFEQAYNMRFEDPDANKGKLVSHARDIAAKYSVRHDATTKRQRARDVEKSRREEEKAVREEEKARLRKLKLDEAGEKLKKIKEAAGMKGKEFDMDQWTRFLTGDWDDEQWEREFEKQFGDDYYAEDDEVGSEMEVDGDVNGEIAGSKKKRKAPKKPTWDDDLDITDLVPDFEEEEAAKFSITDDEAEGDDAEEDVSESTPKPKKKSRDRKKDLEAAKRESKRERRKLEMLVNEQVDADIAIDNIISSKSASQSNKKRKNAGAAGAFRYRETSPTTYGLTANEILMASDAQLNSLVGLKKLATFRDDDKKRKDKKKLGKKARLRSWRKETFGDERGPKKTLQDVMMEAEGNQRR